MSIHYLVDPFTPDSQIIDVTTSENGQTDSTGALLIRVPDGVQIRGKPKNLSELLLAKEAGIQASYVGFPKILVDHCMTVDDTPSVVSPSSLHVSVGADMAQHCIFGQGNLITASVGLDNTPSTCVVVWEAYSFTNNDPSTGRFSRTYVEEDSDLLLCNIAFSGNPSMPITNGSVLNVPVPNQGNAVQLTFTNMTTPAPGRRLYLGGWALIY
jgi:hypothetical protein